MEPLNWKLWLLTLASIALDGGTQLVGWRESNWELRTLTGAMFGYLPSKHDPTESRKSNAYL